MLGVNPVLGEIQKRTHAGAKEVLVHVKQPWTIKAVIANVWSLFWLPVLHSMKLDKL